MAGTYKGTLEALLATVIDGEQGALNVNVVAQGAQPTPMGAYKGTPEALLATVVDGEMGAINVNVLSGGGGGYLSAKVPISAAQILTLDSLPVTLVAAPGAGKALVYLGGLLKWTPGTMPYGGSGGTLGIFYAGVNVDPVAAVAIHTDFANPALDVVLVLSSPNPMLLPISPLPIPTNPALGALSDCTDTALVLWTALPQNMGAITASSLGVGGAGYAPGDTSLVFDDSASLSVNAALAEIVVDTVDGGGAVLTYHLARGGLAYLAGVHGTATETGAGDGNLTIDVTAHALGDGTLMAYVDYVIKDVS